MAEESCPTDSLKGRVCSETVTVCTFSRACLTARNVLGAEGGVHRWLRCGHRSDGAEEEGQVGVEMYLQALYFSQSFQSASLAPGRF